MDILSILPYKAEGQELLWKYDDRTDLYQLFTQYVDVKNIEQHIPKELITFQKSTPIQETQNYETKKSNKIKNNIVPKISDQCNDIKKRLNPIDIAITVSENIDLNSGYIHDKLIEFISRKEFQKFFGVKKTADVMKGLTENKWNKSLVLFMSFIFDIAFIYLKKEVKFNADKKYEQVFTI